ncbi:MAG: arsenate reductase family protein [Peptoniphilaceae bacterium]|nr:arsenate reductase family protein [Peptoniphilaceae bacterium]MDY6085887.1 ArsC/Spx/MgsR family protein [Peptoniphilaceae bacterium]
MQFIGYRRCSTCRSILDLLRQKNVAVNVRDLKQDPPTADEIRAWHEASGLDIGRFYNTSGLSYRNGNIKERRASLTLDEQYALLGSDPMLVKRPILVDGETVLVGADVRRFAEAADAPKRRVVTPGKSAGK